MSDTDKLKRLERVEEHHSHVSNCLHEMDGDSPLWAYAAGNARGLALVMSKYFSTQETVEMAVYAALDEAFDRLATDGFIIHTPREELQGKLDEGFVQGIARAWDTVTDEPLPDEYIEQARAPKDLSPPRIKS